MQEIARNARFLNKNCKKCAFFFGVLARSIRTICAGMNSCLVKRESSLVARWLWSAAVLLFWWKFLKFFKKQHLTGARIVLYL